MVGSLGRRCLLALCFGVWRCLQGLFAPLIVATLPCFCSLSTPTMPPSPFLPMVLSLLGIFASLDHCFRWFVKPFGPVSLVVLCPNFPIFLKLPKLSPSRWDTTDKHRHPRQGQYTGRCTVLSVSEIFWWKVWWSQDFVVTLQTNLDVL